MSLKAQWNRQDFRWNSKRCIDLEKRKETAVVYRQQPIADDVYDMWIETSLAREAKAGQFISVFTRDRSSLLPRPISICETDRENERLRIVYRVAGKGTTEFSDYRAGNKIDILGTLGNGFPTEKAAGKRVFLMGGGIGIPPMLQLAKDITENSEVCIILGYRNSQLFLSEDLSQYGTAYISTEDGSVGVRGNVLDVIEKNGLSADIIYACGPLPMLRAIKKYAKTAGIPAYISLEEKMACGVGACLGCVTRTSMIDHHSHVKNSRICTDGPVYLAEDVEI